MIEITIGELRFGVASMPKGKRRTTYQERLVKDVLSVFAGRILSFDLNASYAVSWRTRGKPVRP